MPLGNTTRRSWLTGLLSIFGLSQIASAETVAEKLATNASNSPGYQRTEYVYDAQGRLISVCVKDDQG
jgi:hypothetical protein